MKISVCYLFCMMMLPSSVSFACLPMSSADTVIGRIAQISPAPKSNAKQNAIITFTDYSWVFRTWKQWWILPSAKKFEGEFSVKSFAPNDIVVALADYQSGQKPHDYTIVSMVKLTCQNNQLILQKPKVIPLGWNREERRCGVGKNYAGLLDGFMDNNQAYYLKKLQQRYPTCEALARAFPKV